MQFFQVKFKWEASVDDGKLKKITQRHIVQAKTCTQVQSIIRQLYEADSPGFQIKQIKQSDIKDVHLKPKK